jgi:hypothetical protein
MKPFDEGLFNLKLQDACRDLHRDTNARLKQVDGHQKKIGQGYGPGWLAKRMDAAIEVFHKYYVPRVDKACRETWLSDHDAITPEFIRGIVVPRVFAFVAARKGAIQGETELLASRTGIGTRLTPALHHLVHEINRVQGDLGTLYEIEARELAKQQARVHHVTQAPAPIQPLRVGGITRAPKPTQLPPDCPLYYPNELKTKTQVIFAEAVRKYPEQTQALELCKYVISEMTPVFRAAVEDGTMKPYQVLSDSGMGGLLHSLLLFNCDHDDERFRLGQELRKSDEWLKLARVIDETKPRSQELSQITEIHLIDPSLVRLDLADFSLYKLEKESDERLLAGLSNWGDRLQRLRQADPDWEAPSVGRQTEADFERERAETAVKQIRHALALRGKLPTLGTSEGEKVIKRIELFTHSDDYRSVVIRGQNFTLTSRQAQVIQILDENRDNGHPDLSQDYILERLGTANSRLRDTFKTNRDAWKALVRPGSTKGTVRLNA